MMLENRRVNNTWLIFKDCLSRLKTGPTPWAGNQVKVTECLQGKKKRSSWLNSNINNKYAGVERAVWGLKPGTCTFSKDRSGSGTLKWTRHTEVHRLWWDACTNAEGACQCHCQAALGYLWKVMVLRREFWGLKENKYSSFLHDGQEGESGKLKTSQPLLNPWKIGGTNNSGKHW